jgi:hypothetical protein
VKVELLEGLVTGVSIHEAGEIVELDEKDARRLIDEGKARPPPVKIQVDSFNQEMSCVF